MFHLNTFVLSSCLALCLTQSLDDFYSANLQDDDNSDYFSDYLASRDSSMDIFFTSMNSSSPATTTETTTTSYEETKTNTADLAQIVQKIAEMENKIWTLTQNLTSLEHQVVIGNANRIEESSKVHSIMNAMDKNLREVSSTMSKSISKFDSFLQEDFDDITDVKNQLNENSKSISLIKSNQQKDHDNIGKMINHLKSNSESISRIDSTVQTNARRINSLSRTSHHHGPPN